jgi:primosomal protein N' (replication factor Y) (superfamily II helicase)
MERITLFADVLLPLPVPGTFTYRVPYDLNDSVGKWKRAVVQFGKKKVYTAIIVNIHKNPPGNYAVKYILSVLDENPVMNDKQYSFWQWIAAYYMCEPGDVMNASLPSALKLASETRVVLNPEFDGNTNILNEKEYLIAEALDVRQKLTLTEIENIIGQKKVFPVIKGLLEKNVVITEEELEHRIKPKTDIFLDLRDEYNNDLKLKELLDQLEKRAFRQVEVMLAYLSLSEFAQGTKNRVSRSQLLGKVKNSAQPIAALIEKGVFEARKEVISRLDNYSATASPDDIIFTEHQQKAIDEIRQAFSSSGVVLFHGITSSGKTEIYIRLISETLKQGKQVLYLLPEIALTTQIIHRLRKYFGDAVGIYHSRYSEQERVEIWNRVRKNSDHTELQETDPQKYQVILGPRSAIFLPFSDLGLIIVDEEHDTSYKQYDPAPRYNARDAAVYLAQLHNAKVVLGTATPSMESYFNANSGKYRLVELDRRFGEIQLPEIFIADLKKEVRFKTMKSHFSSLLLEHVDDALRNGEQVILFQNRRGYSLRLLCDTCGWIPECKNCDVTLIYHKQNNQLRCHYCGYSRRVPERCDACGGTHLQMKGYGTEKLEDELTILYPDAKIKRMDLDTTRSKYAYQNIINDFENRKIDILVGTQMVTKGLDFDNVRVVGIMNADGMISFPDFRSYERSFQLMAQVSGRAGRKTKRGKVIIQTYNPHHSVIRDVVNNDYLAMYRSQLLERRNFNYPPFYRVIILILKHKDPRVLNDGARELAAILRDEFKNQVLGPEYPIVSRIKNLYIKHIMIKLERGISIENKKKLIIELLDRFRGVAAHKAIKIYPDVDPV